MNKVKLKLVSDGTARGTSVVTEDGREVEGIESVTWCIDRRDKVARLVLTVLGCDAEAVAEHAMLGLLAAQGKPGDGS